MSRIKGKKKNIMKKTKLVQNLKWATAHLSRRLGAGRALGRWTGARALGARAAGRSSAGSGGRRVLARRTALGA